MPCVFGVTEWTGVTQAWPTITQTRTPGGWQDHKRKLHDIRGCYRGPGTDSLAHTQYQTTLVWTNLSTIQMQHHVTCRSLSDHTCGKSWATFICSIWIMTLRLQSTQTHSSQQWGDILVIQRSIGMTLVSIVKKFQNTSGFYVNSTLLFSLVIPNGTL